MDKYSILFQTEVDQPIARESARVAPTMAGVRVFLYVDGFNLYYRLLKGNAGTKWLDLDALGGRLFPAEQIVTVRYFTALIKSLDDPRAPARQQIYLRALKTLPNCTIHFGYFQLEAKRRFLKNPIPGQPRTVEVVLPEEKGSDVNLATELLVDAFNRDSTWLR